jgi:hypothetical protein
MAGGRLLDQANNEHVMRIVDGFRTPIELLVRTPPSLLDKLGNSSQEAQSETTIGIIKIQGQGSISTRVALPLL